jgi:L-ascorbate metabolism protein UlaG (beta-lactamase superfamily)
MLQPPSDDWNLAICYVNHAGFLIVSRDGMRALIDPFLSPTFAWKVKVERQLDPAPFRSRDLAPCHILAVTHDHGDHFDVETCRAVLDASPGCALVAPETVIAQARDAGLGPSRFVAGTPGSQVEIDDLSIVCLANRGNEDDSPCPRFSYLLRSPSGATVFHSGDSHGPSPSWSGVVEQPDVALLWPAQIEETIGAIHPRRVWLMHWGRFDPGDFLCNVDVTGVASTLRARFPEVEIIAEPPGAWVTVGPS